MNRYGLRRGIRRVFQLAVRRRDRWERDVEDEIKLHLSLRAEQLADQGRSPDDAYAEAVRRFGPLTESRARLIAAARHREQRMERAEYLDDLRQDLAFAIRTLARQKTWTAITILTLALGMGATTAVFSVVSTFLLHPLDYPNADRIVFIKQRPTRSSSAGGGVVISVAPTNRAVRTWEARARDFDAFAGYRTGSKMLATTGDPSFVHSGLIVPELFALAGQHPLIGRAFTTSDIASGRRVVLLGEGLWRMRLGADRRVLGQIVTLSDTSYMVIGVMPSTFRLPGVGSAPTDVWLPLDDRDDKGGMALLGRLRPGVSTAAAARELDSIVARSDGGESRLPLQTEVLRPAQTLRIRDSLLLLAGAAALVLLVACANVAHLHLARSASRQRELAIRVALGAGRGRLLRQLLTESALLTLAATGCGVLVGWLGLRGMIVFRPGSHDELQAARLDSTTLGVALAVAVVSGIVFGIIGLVQSARHGAHDALKAGSLTTSGSRGHHRVRATLVVTEMALSAMLLVGATMLIRGVMTLQRFDLGFDPVSLYTVYLELPRDRFVSPESRQAFAAEFIARLRTIPGVQSASFASVGPGSRDLSVGRLEVDGERLPPSASGFNDVNAVQPSYFATMRIPIVEGATFTDTTASSRQLIVNSSFARKHWPAGAALGHRVRLAQGDTEPWRTIVGVAKDAATSGPNIEAGVPILYTPWTPTVFLAAVVRTNGSSAPIAQIAPLAKSAGLRRAPNIDGVEAFLSRAISEPRFVMLLLTIFTGLALTLASVGLYGVLAYSIAQETREIGIRIALGATRSRVARRVIARGASLALFGTVLGLVAARWGTKLIEHELQGVARSDLRSYGAAALTLLAAALAACVVPTRRALAVDPMSAIRAD